MQNPKFGDYAQNLINLLLCINTKICKIKFHENSTDTAFLEILLKETESRNDKSLHLIVENGLRGLGSPSYLTVTLMFLYFFSLANNQISAASRSESGSINTHDVLLPPDYGVLRSPEVLDTPRSLLATIVVKNVFKTSLK